MMNQNVEDGFLYVCHPDGLKKRKMTIMTDICHNLDIINYMEKNETKLPSRTNTDCESTNP